MKAEISSILNQKGHNWIPIFGKFSKAPPYNKLLTIRIVDHSLPAIEDDQGITYVEDIKIAQLRQMENGDTWFIEGPFPLYDYSPLTINEALRPGAVVTHWAECTEKHLEFWKHRFDVRGDWKYLSLKVDVDHREIVYRALMHASMVLRFSVNAEQDDKRRNELMVLLNALYDLQAVMDNGGEYDPISPVT